MTDLSMTLYRLVDEYHGGRTYLGAGNFAVTERASAAGDALEAMVRLYPSEVDEASQSWGEANQLNATLS